MGEEVRRLGARSGREVLREAESLRESRGSLSAAHRLTFATSTTALARVGLKSVCSMPRDKSTITNKLRSMPRCTLANTCSCLQARGESALSMWRRAYYQDELSLTFVLPCAVQIHPF